MQAESILPLLPTLNLKSLITMTDSNEITDALIKLKITDKIEDSLNDFPFLNHEPTVDLIKRSKCMFIMRGLPGSGKSTITKQILKTYSENKPVLCSADLYFTDSKTGEYKFNAAMLKTAHETSQNNAREACLKSASPVIIDNTNITLWEFKPYVQIADKFEYILIICEPKTPWKFDAQILFTKNAHNVPLETIKKRLHDFTPITPLYFGWFLNEHDSKFITNKAFKIYSECCKASNEFKADLQRMCKNGLSLDSIFTPKSKALHCTAKFCGKKTASVISVENYLSNALVSQSNGKHFPLRVTAFTITHQTIGAQVVLDDNLEQLGLWANDLSDEQFNDIVSLTVPCQHKDNFKLQRGARAHLTIGLASGTPAVQTGHDLIKILSSLQFPKENQKKIDLEEFEFNYLSECQCYVKLKKPLVLDSLFTLDFF